MTTQEALEILHKMADSCQSHNESRCCINFFGPNQTSGTEALRVVLASYQSMRDEFLAHLKVLDGLDRVLAPKESILDPLTANPSPGKNMVEAAATPVATLPPATKPIWDEWSDD